MVERHPVPAGAGTLRQRTARLVAVLLAVVVLLAGWAGAASAGPFSRTTNNGVNQLRADTLTTPGAPVPLRVSAASGMTTLSWSASRSYASYRIERSTSPSGPFSQIALLSPGAAGFTEFSLPAGTQPHGIAHGPDGALWFTARSSNQIGRITTSGALTWFGIPTPDSRPEAIVAGPDGALWFTETAGNNIGRITVDGTVSEFPVPTPGSVPKGITSGKDGHLYFTSQASNVVGRITAAGVISELVTLPAGSAGPGAIVWGPDDNLWVTNAGTGLARVTPSGALTEHSLPTAASAPAGIAVGPLGNLFVTESAGNKIARVSPYFDSFAATEWGLAAGRSPVGITAGADGALWFAQRDGDRIGRVTSAGNLSEVGLASGSKPTSITTGPDGALWVTEAGTNAIGRYGLGLTTSFTDTTAVADQHYFYRVAAVFRSWTAPQNQVAMSLSLSPSSATDQTEPTTPVTANAGVLARGDNATHTTTGDWRTNWTLRGVDSRDGVRVWAVGDGGLMALSTDGGATWRQQASVTSVKLARVRFLTASTGWAVGDSGTILATTDGGATWSTQISGTTANLRDAGFLDASTGWAVGDGGTVLHWNGTTWSPQASSTTETLRGVAVGSATRAWAVGDRGAIVTFNGVAWSSIEINGQPPLYDIAAADANRAWVAGDGGRLIEINGSTYTNRGGQTAQTLYSVAAAGQYVWVGGANGTIRRYDGSSWSAQTSGTGADITAMSFSDGATGFFVTAGDRPGRTTNSGVTWTGPLAKSVELTLPAATVASGAAVHTLRATLIYRTSAVPSADAAFSVSASFDGGTTWTSRALTRPTTTATVTQSVDFASALPNAAALQTNGIRLRFLVTSSNVFTTTHDAIRVDVN